MGKDLVHWSIDKIKETLLFLNPFFMISWNPHSSQVSFPREARMCDPSTVRRYSGVRGESANLYLFQMVRQACSLLQCSKTVQKICGKFTRFSPVTCFPELLSVESCDICVIQIPYSCVQTIHRTHALSSVSNRNCWQEQSKSLFVLLPISAKMQSFLHLW